MFLRISLFLVTLVIMFTLVYFLLERKNPLRKKEKKENIFNKPLFKKVTGSVIILFLLVLSFRYIKILPLLLKVGLIFINFVIIYIVINYFFNKQKTK
jgi:Na+/H+ antiporter NhaD/arsenite permease-like protein